MQYAYHADLEYYEGRAYGLLESAEDGNAALTGPRTIEGARQAVAAAHGFDSWAVLAEHVAHLDTPFARAYRAIEAHDPAALAAVLTSDLARAEGTNGNDLLSMATATHDERTVRLLLDAGADPNHPNAHGWTAMHQVGYSDDAHLAPLLLAAGGRMDLSGRGDGGTPLVAALFWGHRRVTEILVEAGGVQPRNLRTAAGVGDVALMEELLGTPEAGAHRGFYRPHSGFPRAKNGTDPKLPGRGSGSAPGLRGGKKGSEPFLPSEALSWAARSGRVAALDVLAAAGADLDADVYRGTALTWAAVNGHADAVRRLLELGAAVDALGTFGGESHGQDITALHLAKTPEVARVLLDAGADPTRVDGHGYGPPAGWARHDGRDDVAAVIEAYAA